MKKTWSWSTTGYTFGSGEQALRRVLAVCKSAGLAGIEGVPPLFEGMSDGELEKAARRFKDRGLTIETFHLPFTREDDIAAFYETERRVAVESMATWMRRAARLGARVCIQHPACNRYSVDVEGLDHYLGQLGRSLDTLLPLAGELGLTIALENMLPADGGRFCSRPEHFSLLDELQPHPNLGYCLDTGHALVAGGPERAGEFFQAMRGRLVAFHLADNAGDRDSHLAAGHGRVDWTSFFRSAAELDFAGSMCLETPPFGPGPDYRDEDWRAMVDTAEALAAEAMT